MEISYQFRFDDRRERAFTLAFDDATMLLVKPPGEVPDCSWIRLDCHQCGGCPLDAARTPWCPVACNLSVLLREFSGDTSCSPVQVRVITPQRTIEHHGGLQDGLSSLMGLIMATSGCPVLDVLRPMAFLHLPFASEDETIMRAISSYLIGQLVCARDGKPPDWRLEGFGRMYSAISDLNTDFSQRVRTIEGMDANINALVILDVFAQMGCMVPLDEWIDRIGGLWRHSG